MLKRMGAIARRVLGPPQMDETLVSFHLLDKEPRVMVDVGAHHGESLLPYADRGWMIHAFEPDPHNRMELERRTAGRPNIRISPHAVTTTDGESVSLHTSELSTGISTLQPFHSSHRATTSVTTTRLDTYLREHNVRQVGFLKIDAEGHDLAVLQSFPWNDIHPNVVLCEFEDRKTAPQGHTYRDIAAFLIRSGYSVIVSEWHPITRYGGDHGWRRAVRYPVSLADDAWGNLLGVDPAETRPFMWILRFAGFRLRMRRWVDWLSGPIHPR